MALCRIVPCRTLTLTAKFRSPSIRFRYGASRGNEKAAAPVSAASSSSSGKATQASAEPIWDFQLPTRFRRRPLSEEEIAYINRGGPE